METGKVYVVHNDWIRDPDNNNKPYKIGITKNTVSDRYYGLGLKMPGVFVCDFAYELGENYAKVETALHDILNKLRVNGEWFNADENTLSGIQSMCELLGGRLVEEEVDIPPIDGQKEKVPTKDDWKAKYPSVADTAECLNELLAGRVEKLGVEYKRKNIAFTSAALPPSLNLYLYLVKKEEPNDCLLAFRVKEEARETLKALLEENNIEHTLLGERKVVISPISRQIIERHKDVFIKIVEFIKDYKER